jgi:5-(carboxyamino)imidazole ribonucleotide synthase
MLAMAAAELGFACHVYTPEPDSPAAAVAAKAVVEAWSDSAALAHFARGCDAITFEFENVPIATAEFLAQRRPLYPGPLSLGITQDRVSEKSFVAGLGIPIAPFAPVDSAEDLGPALGRTGRPAVLKTRRFGYDGKGQAKIDDETDPAAAWEAIGAAPAVLEAFVAFSREISVIIARARDGSLAAFDVTENRHESGILATSRVPASVDDSTAAEAVAIAGRIASALDHVGVLAVEFFVVGDGPSSRLIVNEIAPRVHNSGHWTQDAATASQFEQHIRAVAGWPLLSPRRHSEVEMMNLIGAAADGWPALAAEPDAHIHLYGKAEVRPGRKMGHVNRLRPPGTGSAWGGRDRL